MAYVGGVVGILIIKLLLSDKVAPGGNSEGMRSAGCPAVSGLRHPRGARARPLAEERARRASKADAGLGDLHAGAGLVARSQQGARRRLVARGLLRHELGDHGLHPVPSAAPGTNDQLLQFGPHHHPRRRGTGGGYRRGPHRPLPTRNANGEDGLHCRAVTLDAQRDRPCLLRPAPPSSSR